MWSRLFAAACIATLVAAVAGCREKKSSAAVRCEVVDRSVREVGGALEVAVSVRWSVANKNYRLNKPTALGSFDPREHSKAALEEQFKPGTPVACTVDPAHPTRVDLQAARP